MNRRVLPAVVALACGALLLSGCTEITAISEQTGIDLALDGLVSQLKDDYGVTAAPATQVDAEFQYSVTVVLDPEGITPKNRAAVITTADETLGGSAFGSATVNLVIGEYEYTQAVFGQDSLAGDLAYWAEVEDAVGPVSFGISSDPDGDGPQTRARNIYSAGALDYAALVTIELDATALDSWGSLGVSAMGTLPSAAAADVLADLTETIPLYDYAMTDQPLALSLDWYGDALGATWTLHSASLSDWATEPAASADWPTAIAAATGVAAAGMPGSRFSYVSSVGGGGIVELSTCEYELSASSVDTELFAALQTAGVPLPPGSAPGWCSAP